MQLQQKIEAVYRNRELLKEQQYQDAIREAIEEIDDVEGDSTLEASADGDVAKETENTEE